MVHATAGFIDPGFRGTLTLEMTNVGPSPIRLLPGMKICQISFMLLNQPAHRQYGDQALNSKYQDQKDPTPSRYHLNK